MRRYQTEILIPPDRAVVLQIPDHVPAGRAIVTVEVFEPSSGEPSGVDPELDHQDIEWWEEFEDDLGARGAALADTASRFTEG